MIIIFYSGGKPLKQITKYLIIYFSLVSIIGQSAISSEGSTNNFVYVDNDNINGPWDGTQEHPYQHIQDAIDNSLENCKIFVYEGTYYENVIVNKTIELIGENKASTQIDGGEQTWQPENDIGSGVYFIRATNGDKWYQTKKVIYLK